MRKIPRGLSAPLLSLAFLMLSNGFFMTFVSAKLHLEGYSSMAIGSIQGSYYAGFLIAALRSEYLIQRIKHIRAFSFFASITVACTLATVFAHHLILWIVMRFVMGICIAALYVVIESWLLTTSTSKNRGIILALYMASLYISQSLSQYIINFVEIESMMAFIVAGILASISILPVTFTHTRIPEMEPPHPSALFNFLVISPLGTTGAILAGVMLGSLYTFGPNFAQSYNVSIANLMSLTIAGGFLLQYPIGHLSDIFDRRKVLIFVSLMSFVAATALVICAKSTFWVLFFSFVLGGFTFTIYPLSIAQVLDRCKASQTTTVAGVMLFAYSIGAVIGPFTAPISISILGDEVGIYIFIGLVSLLLVTVGVLAMSFKQVNPKRKQEDFVALPPQATLVNDLDPRTTIPEEDPSKQ